MCEGHYTIWQHRRKLIKMLQKDIYQELSFVRQYTVDRPKNYQLWRHRMVLIEELNDKNVLEIELNDLQFEELDLKLKKKVNFLF